MTTINTDTAERNESTDTDQLPNDTICRVGGANPTGQLETGTVGALIDSDHNPEARVDVGHRGWLDAVGLTVAIEGDDVSMSTAVELSPADARGLAAALNQRAAEVERAEERADK